jgi:Family of unknown function (DUF5701)
MSAAPETTLVDELERQVTRLVALGFPEVPDLALPLKERLADLPAALAASAVPFVLVIHPRLASPEACMTLVEHNGRAGVVEMTPTEPAAFRPISEADIPDTPAYLAYGIDTGRETLNVTPDDALPLILREGRSPLTIQEGIAVLIQRPGVLRSANAFSLLGSRSGDRRVPAVWISKGRPRLGWCWAGNPHTWLGSASCAGRLAP